MSSRDLSVAPYAEKLIALYICNKRLADITDGCKEAIK